MTLPLRPPRDLPILIAGPTASGKSHLALELAERDGGRIINADALQVYSCWQVLTARPGPEDLGRAVHHLYGHIAPETPYSVGHWLRDVASLLDGGGPRPIIVGGTGLYFAALTEGLTEIPETPAEVRRRADAFRLHDFNTLRRDLEDRDPTTARRIDLDNPMRVQRAWEVLEATGRPLAAWQDATPSPRLPVSEATALVMEADRDWLNDRIARRFDIMLDQGALEEARAMLGKWSPQAPWARAIGAPELIAHLRGETTMEDAREAAIIASRQYAKRQRTWFRNRMRAWTAVTPD